MNIQEFAAYHLPQIRRDEVRFNVQVAVLAAAAENCPPGFAFWSLGAPGHCAIKSPGRSILLGELDEAECRQLACETRDLDYEGVVGADELPACFVRHANALGIAFDEEIPQRIHVLDTPPNYPQCDGSARTVNSEDSALLFEWMTAFHREAAPHDPAPQREHIEKAAGSGRFDFWTVDGEPVSMAAITRRLSTTAAIAPVYTPEEHRGKGYAGAATASVASRIFAEGKSSACLFTDLRNPYSNRCYAKIGFKPYCESWHYIRAKNS
jgi:RimJ/RimL family protein N-acetyltransferase